MKVIDHWTTFWPFVLIPIADVLLLWDPAVYLKYFESNALFEFLFKCFKIVFLLTYFLLLCNT